MEEMGERSTILKETILFFSQSALIEEIQSVDWNAIFSDNSDIDSIFTNFYTQITHVFDMQKMVWVFLNCKFDMRWLVGPIQASRRFGWFIILFENTLSKYVRVEECESKYLSFVIKIFARMGDNEFPIPHPCIYLIRLNKRLLKLKTCST